ESGKDVGANGAKRLGGHTPASGNKMAPLTWDPNTPAPSLDSATPEGTERTPVFETAELIELEDSFGEGEGERTSITVATPYDLRPPFTGRAAALQQLQAMV